MTHNVRGYIANKVKLNEIANKYSTAKIESLAVNDLAFLPLTDELSKEIGHFRFCENVKGLIAYIETDYFGGFGKQFAALWENGKKKYSNRNTFGPINDILKLMGVSCKENLDEFDTIGLNKFRTMDYFKV